MPAGTTTAEGADPPVAVEVAEVEVEVEVEKDGPAPNGQRNERGRDPLLAAICHDLRAPLAAVTMGANFVLSTTPENEATTRSRRVLQAMLRSCKQMERLVRDFGDLAEIEAGTVALRLGEHEVGEMAEIAAQSAGRSATERGVLVVVTRPVGATTLRCDRERLLRALDHVIENATRMAPQGSSVALTARDDGAEVSFTITDHGPGLSEETFSHLYDRQWHAKRPGRTGAGLGLAIVRGLVEAHGGRVEVDSKPGATTFALILPKEDARPSCS